MDLPVILTDKNSTDGAKFVRFHKFIRGGKVPIYEISTMNALNQVIGHAKFVNKEYGNVYYRGVTAIFDNVLPSIFRKRTSGKARDLRTIINEIYKNPRMLDSLKLTPASDMAITSSYYKLNAIDRNNKYIIEALLQHYAGNTSFVDVVDNHWVALWMGLNELCRTGRGYIYCRYHKRQVLLNDIIEKTVLSNNGTIESDDIEQRLYSFILLLAMPNANEEHTPGVKETDSLVEVDLRKALPSIYLRPHAQHALVVRKHSSDLATDYDLASQVVGILRIRVDYAAQWLGDGQLLTQDNLFPPPSFDQGYDNLLRNALFKAPFEIIRYY